MDLYFPEAGWIRLRRDILDTLSRFKSQHGIPSWDATMETLLERAREAAQ